jgi:hypothetical protein
MLGTGIIGRRMQSWFEPRSHVYNHDRWVTGDRHYWAFKDDPLPVRLSWKEEAKQPWPTQKPKAKEISSDLYKLLARSN